MVTSYVPARGDIVWLNFNPQQGHEQAGTRPALVVSAQGYNKLNGLMLACPITSKVKGYPFEVLVKAGKIEGVILADHIKCLDWNVRGASFLQKAPATALAQTQELIELLITG